MSRIHGASEEARESGAISMKRIIVGILRGYKRFLSPLLPPSCRFEPTCSAYLIQAVEKKGIVRGILMGVWRLLRCQPFSKGGYDPVR